jgi:peptidoglycan/xylan/chitin deacetylase (PgdA/CDA1 family)
MKTIFFHGDRNKKEIALTFDDGPCKRSLEILKVLKKENIPATFFVLGKKIKGNENLLKLMIKQGCEIGNHTYNHTNLIFKTQKRMKEELLSTDKELYNLNIKTNLMRCPHFMCGLAAFFLAKKLNKKIIFADLDSWDWRQLGKKAIVSRVLRKVKNGSIIGFHDYLEEIGENKEVVPTIKKIIPKLKERGYRFVTISKLLA